MSTSTSAQDPVVCVADSCVVLVVDYCGLFFSIFHALTHFPSPFDGFFPSTPFSHTFISPSLRYSLSSFNYHFHHFFFAIPMENPSLGQVNTETASDTA